MKKTLLVAALSVTVLAALTTGVVAAQGANPPQPGPGGRGGPNGQGPADPGPMHEYMEKALADALGISVDELETQQEAGKRPFQIALDLGFTQDEIPALLQDAHIKGLEAAAADGVISQEMLEWMKGRIEACGAGEQGGHPFMRGFMRGYRFNQNSQ